MPTYEYQCTQCGHTFDQQQAITDTPLEKCPNCQGRVKRLLSGGAGFVMKGGSQTHGTDCSFERTGQTCCGRQSPCGTKSCARH